MPTKVGRGQSLLRCVAETRHGGGGGAALGLDVPMVRIG